jgi:flotillin
MKAAIRESEAERSRMQAKFENDTRIAQARRDYDLNEAINNKTIKTQQATADLAQKLQSAKTTQKVTEEEMKIKIVQRSKQIELQDQEIMRREKELDARIRKPAEAEKYEIETIARAQMQKQVLEAEAEAESIKLKGEARGFSIEAKARVKFFNFIY